MEIRPPYITLGALLKLENLAATGGEAKALIGGRRVRVNGEIEIRRGRKLVAGDRINVEGTGATLVIRHFDAPATASLDPRVS